MSVTLRLLILLGALHGLAVVATAAENAAAGGQQLVEANCARCHAIGKTGKSPLAKAPTFRDVMKRYDASNLEEALAEGIVTGHNEMPEFTFEADQIAAIVAYLSTLQKK